MFSSTTDLKNQITGRYCDATVWPGRRFVALRYCPRKSWMVNLDTSIKEEKMENEVEKELTLDEKFKILQEENEKLKKIIDELVNDSYIDPD